MPNSHEAELEEIKSTLEAWRMEAHQISVKCGKYAIKYKRLNHLLGIPIIIFSTISGSTAFIALISAACPQADIPCNDVVWDRRLIVAVLSISAAILAGLQNFLRFGELAEKYLSVGIGYQLVIKDIEGINSKYKEEESKIKSKMERLAEMMPDVLDFGLIHKNINQRNIASLRDN